MKQITPVPAATPPALSLLERILNRVLQCSHRQLGRPITLHGESFAVCLDCGRRIAYDLREFRTGTSAQRASSPGKISAAPKEVLVTAPARGWWERCDALGHWLVTRKPATWGGLLALGLAAGLFFSVHQPHPRAQHVISRRPLRRMRAAEHPPAGLKSWAQARPAAPPAIESVVKTPLIRVSDAVVRLDGDGRDAVLARDVNSGLEVSHHPGRLNELIRSGSLFTVGAGTAVRIRNRKKTIVRVLVLDGPMAGQQGWAQASQVR